MLCWVELWSALHGVTQKVFSICLRKASSLKKVGAGDKTGRLKVEIAEEVRVSKMSHWTTMELMTRMAGSTQTVLATCFLVTRKQWTLCEDVSGFESLSESLKRPIKMPARRKHLHLNL